MGFKSSPPKQPSIEKQQQLQNRKEPLLGESIQPNVGTNQTNRGSCCARVFFAIIPLLSSAFIIAFLYILIFQGGNDPTQVLIGQAMAEYERQGEILAMAIMGSLFTIITTISREVQVRVYFSKEGTYTWGLTAMNTIGTLTNILAYVGYLLTVLNKYDDEDEKKALLHVGGVLMFFVLAPLYALLQCALLFKQKKYSLFIKIVFVLVAVTEYAVAIAYLVLKDLSIQLQWFAVALMSLFTGLFSILFLVDPVDHELKEYFTFGCCRKKSGVSDGKGTRDRKDSPPERSESPSVDNRPDDISLA
mmetsp:Transcript_20301/g.31753  ORF Transcript_20301/g.31753 Transcript_20301/m.31753 type:complete len:304 (+) Transcript_20301:227-1138(+)|eukprot:CAMPEP_0201729566 /NCGR_PEP_ID=MMETSP0593-20130828/19461_1 /ASSEMBLY_ACC=CAM_ASM_000672 /TAXON_ID=267983 /ORGANISM="Skeletonema japonicum, Strain CCMP2506" /LENGTH=303 /DNA_ID=CAMNT_0048221931 /DNA_START=146 /DNA_END=1057 /DNA_ORIENTATION=+